MKFLSLTTVTVTALALSSLLLSAQGATNTNALDEALKTHGYVTKDDLKKSEKARTEAKTAAVDANADATSVKTAKGLMERDNLALETAQRNFNTAAAALADNKEQTQNLTLTTDKETALNELNTANTTAITSAATFDKLDALVRAQTETERNFTASDIAYKKNATILDELVTKNVKSDPAVKPVETNKEYDTVLQIIATSSCADKKDFIDALETKWNAVLNGLAEDKKKAFEAGKPDFAKAKGSAATVTASVTLAAIATLAMLSTL